MEHARRAADLRTRRLAARSQPRVRTRYIFVNTDCIVAMSYVKNNNNNNNNINNVYIYYTRYMVYIPGKYYYCIYIYTYICTSEYICIYIYLLLALVRELESRRGEISNLYAKIKKDQLLRAPSVGKHNSTRVDEGRKSWNLLAIKKQGTNRSAGRGGEEPAM